MRVCFLTHRLPYAPNRGDRIRAYHILEWLHRRTEVHLLSLVHDPGEEQAAAEMTSRAASVNTSLVPRWMNRVRGVAALPTRRPLTLTLLDAPALRTSLRELARTARPDVILAYCSSMAAYAMSAELDGIPFVLDMVDVDSEKWQSLAEHGRRHLRPIYAREARTLRAFERRAMRAARTTIAINQREAQALRQLAPEADIVTIGNGVAFESFAPPSLPGDSASVVFCGVMDYAPNEAAALRLIRHIWPMVHLQMPDATLWLVGSRRLRSAASDRRRPGVDPHYRWCTGRAALPVAIRSGCDPAHDRAGCTEQSTRGACRGSAGRGVAGGGGGTSRLRDTWRSGRRLGPRLRTGHLPPAGARLL